MNDLRDRSLALTQVRWAAVALLLVTILVRVMRAEVVPPSAIAVVVTLPLFNLAATLLHRAVLSARVLTRFLLGQCLLDAIATALLAQALPATFLLPLALVPVAVARDELGCCAVMIVALAAALVSIAAGLMRLDTTLASLLWSAAAILAAAGLLIWLRAPRSALDARDTQRAKASVLRQLAQNFAAPLATRAGMIRARADHIELVLPEGDMPAIGSAGRVIRESADEIQHFLRPWRSLVHPTDRAVDLDVWLREFVRRHAAARVVDAAPATIALEEPDAADVTHGHPLSVAEGGAQSVVLLLEALAARTQGALRVRLCPVRGAVMVTLACEAHLAPSHLPADVRAWSRLSLRAALSLIQQIGGTLILWRRGRSLRGADLKLPRLAERRGA